MKKNHQLLHRLRDLDLIRDGDVVLRSGKRSSVYCDIKKAYGYPEILSEMADEIIARLKKKENCVAVSGHGGLPLGAVIAARSGRRLIIIRNELKGHGKQSLIDGYKPNRNDKVVIIDDVLTTGSSIRATLRPLRKTGALVTRAIVVVERKKAKLPIPNESLFSIQDF